MEEKINKTNKQNIAMITDLIVLDSLIQCDQESRVR